MRTDHPMRNVTSRREWITATSSTDASLASRAMLIAPIDDDAHLRPNPCRTRGPREGPEARGDRRRGAVCAAAGAGGAIRAQWAPLLRARRAVSPGLPRRVDGAR